MSEHAAARSPAPHRRRSWSGSAPTRVDAALRYAVEEAARAGCGIHLVHVVPVVPLGSEAALVSAEVLDKLGSETLDLATERPRRWPPVGCR